MWTGGYSTPDLFAGECNESVPDGWNWGTSGRGPHASDPIPGLSWEAQLWGGGASGAKGQVDAALTSLKAIAGGHLSEVGFTRA